MRRFANRRHTALSFFAAALVVVASSPTAAQAPGVRGGVSVNPDQVYLGGHFESGPLVEQLHFRPNIEIGFGDDVTHVGFNFEFVYKFPLEAPWTVYAGAGPAINVFNVDNGNRTDPGLNLLAGAETERGLFFEVKVGVIDSPDLKFAVGWTFR